MQVCACVCLCAYVCVCVCVWTEHQSEFRDEYSRVKMEGLKMKEGVCVNEAPRL